MSRTAHHIRSHRLGEVRRQGGHPVVLLRSVMVVDLRYPVGELRRSAAEGRRPRPRRMRFRHDCYSYLAVFGRGSEVGEWANLDERRERRRLRDQLAEIRKLANAGGDVGGGASDVPPFRPRHNAIWLA
ncbi:hypothetical protein ACQP1V_09465 [Microtetraspora malaysiensis]|uniref:hypothetical protein n=1 Tax=Microtetraspora malaysiensis TaxID=161358 RepID=UPI003D8C85EC